MCLRDCYYFFTSITARVRSAGTSGQFYACRFSCNGRRSYYMWQQSAWVVSNKIPQLSSRTRGTYRTSPSAAKSWRLNCIIRTAWLIFFSTIRCEVHKYFCLCQAAINKYLEPIYICSISEAALLFPTAHQSCPSRWDPLSFLPDYYIT